jgi:TonB family protein
MTKEKTDNKRTYTFNENFVTIEDVVKDTVAQRGTIYGLKDIDKINEFAWYCISEGNELNYRENFKTVSGSFDFYHKGNRVAHTIIKGDSYKYGQLWDRAGKEVLREGTGELVFIADSHKDEVHENYVDSALVSKYGIRLEKKDTIYHKVDKMASPKEGIPNFYKYLVDVLKYPGFARIVGKEGRVYVEFIVDENGSLTDFRPLTKEGYRFEAKAIKKLEQSPHWIPAVYKGRNVKTRFVLPIKFELR